MAITTLPYPSMDFVPLDILTATELDQLVANIEAINNTTLATSAIADGAITTAKIADDGVTVAKIDYSGHGRFSRKLGSNTQNISANTATTVLFPDAVVTDVGVSYSSGIFTVSQAGWWSISSSVRASGGASTGVLRLKINGATTQDASGTAYANSSVSTVFYPNLAWEGHLAVGDTFSIEVQVTLATSNTSDLHQLIHGCCILPD